MSCPVGLNQLLEGRKRLEEAREMNPASEVVKEEIIKYNKLIDRELNG